MENLKTLSKCYKSHLTVKNKRFLLAIPLILSAFTHLWNPIGYPSVHVDEGHYLRRAMQVMEGVGFQEMASSLNEHRQYRPSLFRTDLLGFSAPIIRISSISELGRDNFILCRNSIPYSTHHYGPACNTRYLACI